MSEVKEYSLNINNQKLTLQFGKFANQSTSSVFASMGETCVLVTIVAGRERKDLDYFPLQVEYAEKLYAGGRIKGSRWVKREGRPTDEAILISRLIDRSIRPYFPKSYRRDVQIVITLLSVDGINTPDILGLIATSAALHVSSIPWDGPVSMVRVGYVESNGSSSFVVNPHEAEDTFSRLDLVVTSREDKVVMIETQSEQLSENVIKEAIQIAKKENAKIQDFINDLRSKIGADKEEVSEDVVSKDVLEVLKSKFKEDIQEFNMQLATKEGGFSDAFKQIMDKVLPEFEGKDDISEDDVSKAIDYYSKQLVCEYILDNKKRLDGRKPNQIRDLKAEVSILPRTHGTGLFQRGETQALSIATLGAPNLSQLIESPEGESAKRYMHHYYMPPYSVGETGRIGTPSRREIGHGALAEKAIEPVFPSEKDFPYSVRVVSEVLSSNGSTSMASTCGSTLALMDAGVPIKAPVAGIAIGLVSRSDDDYIILTDIMGLEDFSGEMDFKVAGTREGITAIQLDVKNMGLTDKMIDEILAYALDARLKILDVMDEAISEPRKSVSDYAPKIVVIQPPKDKIGEIIGPGGRNIRNLIARTETEIDIDDDGVITISGRDRDKVNIAINEIESITRELEPGEKFTGEVKRILAFGAFVEITPGRDGLVHVSKMGEGFVKDPNDVVKIGDMVNVEILNVDDQGRINLRLLTK